MNYTRVLNPLDESTQELLKNARVLVVGAGGIGCELIKNLALSGFKNLEVIDLDTIDISNLNRQFLFRRRHVGKSKATIAHESAAILRPDVNIVSHHASIFNSEFNVEYVKKFNIVLNALDNRAARNHVNRLCLAAGVPLVDSGSAGYLGQVCVISKGLTECYECSPKPRQKTFPGCTIRNTPSELIHCVVWAKHLFNQLFGEEDADEDVSPDTADPEAAGSSRSSSSELERVSTRLWAKENDYIAEKMFNKLFKADIIYLLSMKKLWEKRQAPVPVDWFDKEYLGKYPTSAQCVYMHDEHVAIFNKSIKDLKGQLKICVDGTLVWDKDNDAAMSFVASAANIRAKIFGISQKSFFEIKSMAGNIIPAIATTNAMVAGLIVLQALCILQYEISNCRNVFVSRVSNPAKKLLMPCSLDPPRTSCYVCAEKPEVTIQLNAFTQTLYDFKEKVLKAGFGMLAPDVEIDGTGLIVLSSEDGESDDSLPKTLSEFNIGHGSRLRVDDFLQNYNLVVNVLQDAELPEGTTFRLVSGSAVPGPDMEGETGALSSGEVGNVKDHVGIVEDTQVDNGLSWEFEEEKRKRKSIPNDLDDKQPSKRARMSSSPSARSDDNVQVIE